MESGELITMPGRFGKSFHIPVLTFIVTTNRTINFTANLW